MPPLTLQRMTDALRHRGPDGEGHWHWDQGQLALGHRRLAIVDLGETGRQPMHSASQRFALAFNGEIYNFRALRRELQAQGHRFRGSSDTEVMLAAFEQAGVHNALASFSGMFAFALFDRTARVLWLVRDRLGEKPLYLMAGEHSCIFGSELKALRAHGGVPTDVSGHAIATVLRYGYVPAPHTIYHAVRKLRPGELVKISERADGTLEYQWERYWHPVMAAAKAREQLLPAEHAPDEVERVLSTVVSEQMLADVPVGAFLSGGIDSSLIVALMQRHSTSPIRTYTIAFADAEHDESPHADRIARHLGTDHCEVRLDAREALTVLERLPEIFDEPFADSSQLPAWLVARETRKHVTVALTGDGGDEFFGGYSQYIGTDTVGRVIAGIPFRLQPATGALIERLPAAVVEKALDWRGGSGWSVATRQRLLRGLRQRDKARLYEDRQAPWIDPFDLIHTDYRTDNLQILRQNAMWADDVGAVEATMLYDTQTYLPDDILVKVDRTSMANSLETRAPLLDHRVFDVAWRTGLGSKINGGRGKVVLRDILARHVPRGLFERPKQGFAIPLASWLRTELRDWTSDLLADSTSNYSPLRMAHVRKVWAEHLSGTRDHSERVWSALMLLQWYRHHRSS